MAIKAAPVRVFQGQAGNALSDIAAYCGDANAVHVAVLVGGSSPSATISVEGSDAEGGNYVQLPDPNARQTGVSGSLAFEVNTGTAWVKVRIADLTGGTFTVIVTPYVSAGSRQRPQYYDRNPSAVHAFYNGGTLAPHAVTQRWQYTVPTGKKAWGEYVLGAVTRVTAASVAGTIEAYVQVFVNALTYSVPIWARVLTNNVADAATQTNQPTALLNAGEYVRGYTGDSSTGGTAFYVVTAKFTEFDA